MMLIVPTSISRMAANTTRPAPLIVAPLLLGRFLSASIQAALAASRLQVAGEPADQRIPETMPTMADDFRIAVEFRDEGSLLHFGRTLREREFEKELHE